MVPDYLFFLTVSLVKTANTITTEFRKNCIAEACRSWFFAIHDISSRTKINNDGIDCFSKRMRPVKQLGTGSVGNNLVVTMSQGEE